MAFIGLDRGIVDHWIYQDSEYFKVWFEMLYRARYSKEPYTDLVEGELVVINYGQFIYGRIKWSQRLKVSEQRLRTLIKKLKEQDMIEVVSEHRKFTLYNIKNYSKFNQQSNQQETQSYQGIEDDANQQINHPATSSQPAANQQPTTKEQRKKDNKEKKDNNTFSAYTSNTDLLIALNSFEEFRKKIKKPLNDRAKGMLLKKLDGLDSTDQGKIDILDQSIFNGWQGIFAVKTSSSSKSTVGKTGQAAYRTEPVKTIDQIKAEEEARMQKSREERSSWV